MDLCEILPKLFVGSFPESRDDIERLHQTGVTAVLNLQTDDDMRHFNLDWNRLATCYRSCGIHLRRVPLRDSDPLDLQQKLPSCVSALKGLMDSAHTVYLHCSAGAGRSPTVAVAYLSWCCGWDLEAALNHVKQCRPCLPDVEAIRLAGRVS